MGDQPVLAIVKETALLQAASREHLNPAMWAAIDSLQWLNKTQTSYSKRNCRQVLEFTRERMREALAALDAFEAAVWPACAPAPVPEVDHATEVG